MNMIVPIARQWSNLKFSKDEFWDGSCRPALSWLGGLSCKNLSQITPCPLEIFEEPVFILCPNSQREKKFHIEFEYLGRAPVGKKDLRIHSSGGLCFLLGRSVGRSISSQLLPILIGSPTKGSAKCFKITGSGVPLVFSASWLVRKPSHRFHSICLVLLASYYGGISQILKADRKYLFS